MSREPLPHEPVKWRHVDARVGYQGGWKPEGWVQLSDAIFLAVTDEWREWTGIEVRLANGQLVIVKPLPHPVERVR